MATPLMLKCIGAGRGCGAERLFENRLRPSTVVVALAVKPETPAALMAAALA